MMIILKLNIDVFVESLENLTNSGSFEGNNQRILW